MKLPNGDRATVDIRKIRDLEFAIHKGSVTAVVRSAWIVLAGEEVPRLVTCFVKGWSAQ